MLDFEASDLTLLTFPMDSGGSTYSQLRTSPDPDPDLPLSFEFDSGSGFDLVGLVDIYITTALYYTTTTVHTDMSGSKFAVWEECMCTWRTSTL
jgi:hypothetical protein